MRYKIIDIAPLTSNGRIAVLEDDNSERKIAVILQEHDKSSVSYVFNDNRGDLHTDWLMLPDGRTDLASLQQNDVLETAV